MIRTTSAPRAPTLLAASAVKVDLTGTTAETTLASVAIPPLGPNSILDVRTVWTYANSANTKTLRVRLSGASGTAFGSIAATTTASCFDATKIVNRGATNSQIGWTQNANSGGSNLITQPTTAAVDTSLATTLVISGQLGLGTETATLEAYEVWLTQ